MKFSELFKTNPSGIILQSIFIRFMGVIYLIAFVSLGTQVLGLMGSEGILPVSDFLKEVEKFYGGERFGILPTLFWLNTSDFFLGSICWLGVGLSLLLIFYCAPRIILFFLWLFYLSFNSVGREFLAFQWDSLLLEAGFLSIFFAPSGIRPKLFLHNPPSLIGLWLLRWLLFRLIFESGMVKLLSGDQTWADLTAMSYHYMTQPLPNVISWYLYQAPLGFHKISCFFVLVVELLVPIFIFLGKRMRYVTFFILVIFQGFIILTGNYCFFNYLTIVLCLTLLDDAFLKKLLPDQWIPQVQNGVDSKSQSHIKRILGNSSLLLLAILILTISSVQMFPRAFLWIFMSKPYQIILQSISPFRSLNNYGLFAIMTTRRPEIIIEGSNDQEHWIPYEFKWKPGQLHRAPGWVAPHQPRLDWQMWFAALGTYRENPWLIRLLVKLLQGSEPVLNLLAVNPFSKGPPQYIRATLFDYQFTDFKSRKETGQWWQRQKLGLYCPILSKKSNSIKP